MVELLVALALSAMLLGAVIGLLGLLHRQCEAVSARGGAPWWAETLRERLFRDLANARRIVVEPDRLELVGYNATSVVGGESLLRPAKVTYRVVKIGTAGCLFREEVGEALHGSPVRRVQLATTAASRIEFRAPETAQAEGRYAGLVPAVARIRIVLQRGEPGWIEYYWCR